MELWDILDQNRKKTGKTVIRGTKMQSNEYHLVVDVWIKNSDHTYLITKRTPNKTFPNMWTIPGGSAIVGDTSLEAALREVNEEIGIDLTLEKGQLVKSFKREHLEMKSFKDIWFFQEEVNLENVVHQIDEVSDTIWASEKQIRQMIKKGQFIDVLTYLEDVFQYKEQ